MKCGQTPSFVFDISYQSKLKLRGENGDLIRKNLF